jgi:hypothetical protein
MYPMPEYRPRTPQSATQPEMIDTVKTCTRTRAHKEHPNPGGKRREKKGCVSVRAYDVCYGPEKKFADIPE